MGSSIDAVFINKLMRTLKPKWVRPEGSNWARPVPCGGRKTLIEKMPEELQNCCKAGADTTLMVWADCDDDCADGESLKHKFWAEAQQREVRKEDFDRVVFIFAKDRIENWIEFLATGSTDEAEEGPRVKNHRRVADAARELAKKCRENKAVDNMPPSLQWSCNNWRTLVERMKKF